MIKLVKGTKENLVVDVTDKLNNLTTLAGSGVKFDVRKRDDTSWVSQNLPATFSNMRAFCLIDTTIAGYVEAEYELFLIFSNLPEVPRLGPHVFEVANA